VEREDVKNILKTIAAAYPNSYRNLTKEDSQNMIDVWHKCLVDYGSELIEAELFKYIQSDKSGFPPAIGVLTVAADKHKRSSFDVNEFFERAVARSLSDRQADMKE